MQLYISSVSNLTDARFFSAYGVSYFGFCFDVLNPNAVSIDQAKAIISWLHEPMIIGQFGDHQSWEEMQYVDAQLPLHAVQISSGHPEKEIIAKTKWISEQDRVITDIPGQVFISADWTIELLQEVLPGNPYGIHIACTKEEKPGISRVDLYADWMEILEPHLT